MSEILLAIDPGKHHSGWAIFVDKTLVRAGVERVKPPRDSFGPYFRQGRHKNRDAQSALILAELINAHLEIARRFPGVEDPVDVVIEMMHVYVDENGKLTQSVDPNDLLFIQATGGAIAGEVRAPKRLRYVEAGEWKKQRSDAATWAMIRGASTPNEIETLKQCGVHDDSGGYGKNFHHGLEAHGIGLWAHFRL